METRWYGLKEMARELDMSPRSFRAALGAKVFPRGVVRPGEKQPKWSHADLEAMKHRICHSARYE